MRACSFVGNVETLQQDRSVALGGVAVFFADDAFKFAELHAVFVGHVMLGVNRIALLHGGPQALVAHDDGVDRGVSVEGKLVLAQNSELARTHHRPFLRLQFAAEQLHKRRLARAIGSGQAIALARRKRRGDFVEQYFGAVAHGNITD